MEFVELIEGVREDDVRRALAKLQARRALIEFDRACAVRFAEHLWGLRTPRKSVVRQVQQRYGLKQRLAYIVADEGLERFASACKKSLRLLEVESDNERGRDE